MFAKIFVALSIVEPGVNWQHESFRWSMEEKDPWILGWNCTSKWTSGEFVRNYMLVEFF